MGWRTKGMNRDLAVSVFSADFTFENHNLRLATTESNTLMSWVNEKGPQLFGLSINKNPWIENSTYTNEDHIEGMAIGTAVLNHQLVIFTTTSRVDERSVNDRDCIYVFIENKEGGCSLKGELIYKGNLNFNAQHPLETLVSYEAEHIQKVYWTDGENQPRVINIAADKSKLERWNHADSNDPHDFSIVDTFFDFIPAFSTNEEVAIVKNISGGGLFSPGTIQYAFTYFNRYGQQSNIFYLSPIDYLTFSDRAGSPEERVSCAFTISISGLDRSFDKVRIYSIQRTSLNLDPIVRIVKDITIVGDSFTFIDKGTSGSAIDPTELLFVGGREIHALTMTDKDNTLFVGNFKEITPNTSILQARINEYRSSEKDQGRELVTFTYDNDNSKTLYLGTVDSYYSHYNTLKEQQRKITTYKGGEEYRFGFQLQKKTGEWVPPIWFDDATNPLYPNIDFSNNSAKLVYAEGNVPIFDIEGFKVSDYIRIRPVVIFPSIVDRNVLCQGVLNPTVFNVEDRKDNSPFAQASWYFRPYIKSFADLNPDSLYYIPKSEATELKVEKGWESSDKFSFEDQAWWEDQVDQVYVLVAKIDKQYAAEVLARGYLTYREGTNENDNIQHLDFDRGVIFLKENPSYVWYVFVRGSYWSDPIVDGEKCYMDRGIVEAFKTASRTLPGQPSSEEISFKLYKKAKKTSTYNLLYYDVLPEKSHWYENIVNLEESTEEIPRGDFGKYTFKFAVGLEENPSTVEDEAGIYYKVEIKRSAVGDYSYDAISKDGAPLAFSHYASIPTQEESKAKEWQRSVEIQGSIKSYNTPFSEDKILVNGKDVPSNTQFFIDQSIVTLNSPDLEFNTETQIYNMEDIKLRIVGVVPITASYSSHAIYNSSAMLETNHNDNGNGISHEFGKGETGINVYHLNTSAYAAHHLVTDLLWQDSVVVPSNGSTYEDHITTESLLRTFNVYPWHRKGSLNNDYRTEAESSSFLQKKQEANSLFSLCTEYFHDNVDSNSWTNWVDFENHLSAKTILTENSYIHNVKLKPQLTNMGDDFSEVYYYPHIDKALYNSLRYNPATGVLDDDKYEKVATLVPMKYKSTTHAVIAFNGDYDNQNIPKQIPILPKGKIGDNVYLGAFDNAGRGFWQKNENSSIQFNQNEIDISGLESSNFGFLWLGELYKDSQGSKFGGSEESNEWIIAGDAVDIKSENITLGVNNAKYITLKWTTGDTYYQRYDCLKTYAFTDQDPNQIVEILSFMCETHVNIDGRYDKMRNNPRNHIMNPTVFNQLNPVYSQTDNFFPQVNIDADVNNKATYPNHVYYSKTKHSGEDVDMYTNITLSSVLELDGDKGELNKLVRFNDQIIAFQDTGISQVLYNENVQVASTQGVPIEIANSGKVQGARYLSDTIGCSNKWSVVSSPSGVYFMDSNNKAIYQFNGQLANLTETNGFSSWAHNAIPDPTVKWNPKTDFKNFVAYFDKKNQDILFIKDTEALAFSEKLGNFTSFYDYGNTPYLSSLDDIGVWAKPEETSTSCNTKLYRHQTGEYCNFFGVNKPYSMTLVANAEGQTDKTFSTLEFRASVDLDYNSTDKQYDESTPFDSLEAWNEYQHGIANIDIRRGHTQFVHHTGNTADTLKRKFRIWRCDIPRDNYPIPEDRMEEEKRGIFRNKCKPLNRMRNPWIYFKLEKKATSTGFLNRAEIHDIMLTYFI